MQVSEELIQKIKDGNDIVDVISEEVKLKKAGRNYSGLCPFHSEKSPSFSVSPDKQIYKCFGCGEAGNVVSFIMKKRNMNFLDALKYLADRASIPFELNAGRKSSLSNKKEQLYKINVEAARFLFSNLFKNKIALDYFLNRGMSIETVKRFGLGYSLDSWNSMLYYLKKKGFKEELILEAGLAVKSQKGTVYDRFRNRVMFPVFDYRGKVIGFGGRVLDDSKPKYLNSPETPVFNKGINLYGLNFAIKNGLKEDYIIMVEGYMDCISLHQSGITNVVASLGTALTINQARLLKRYTEKVVICYDADLAGQNATLRGLEILRKVGFDVRVINIPKGKDPDEFIKANGKEAFLRLVDKALPLIEYRIEKCKDGLNLKSQDDIIKYGEKVTEVLVDLNPVEKDVYIKKISEETGVKEQALYDWLSNKMTNNNNINENVNNKEENGTKLYVEPAYIKAERFLLNIMTKDEFYNKIVENIKVDEFNMNEHKSIYELLKKAKGEKNNNLSIYMESRMNNNNLLKEWTLISSMDIIEVDLEKQIEDYIKEVKKFKLEKLKEDLKAKVKACSDKGMFDESIKFVKELNDINNELNKLVRG